MARYTLGIMAHGDDEPVRRIAIQAGDVPAAKSEANAAYEKVRREYPEATELHLADGSGQAWNRTISAGGMGDWVSAP